MSAQPDQPAKQPEQSAAASQSANQWDFRAKLWVAVLGLMGVLVTTLGTIYVSNKKEPAKSQSSTPVQVSVAPSITVSPSITVTTPVPTTAGVTSATPTLPLINCLPNSAIFATISEATLPKAMKAPGFQSAVLIDMVQQGNIPCLKAWLAAGSSPNGDEAATNGMVAGQTPLVAALQAGQLEAVKLLLESGADVNLVALARPGKPGLSPLLAASINSESAAVAILAKNPNVQFADDHGWTALHRAALKGYQTLAEQLLARGASKSARLSPLFGEKTPKDLAADNQHLALAGIL